MLGAIVLCVSEGLWRLALVVVVVELVWVLEWLGWAVEERVWTGVGGRVRKRVGQVLRRGCGERWRVVCVVQGERHEARWRHGAERLSLVRGQPRASVRQHPETRACESEEGIMGRG